MSKILSKLLLRFSIGSELIHLLWDHKLWWAIPIIFILLIIFVIIIIGQTTGVGAFIYPLF